MRSGLEKFFVPCAGLEPWSSQSQLPA
jgi:hypothetical protein